MIESLDESAACINSSKRHGDAVLTGGELVELVTVHVTNELLTIIDSSYLIELLLLVMVALAGTADMANGAADAGANSSMKATFLRLRMVVSSSGKSDGVGETAEFNSIGDTPILLR